MLSAIDLIMKLLVVDPLHRLTIVGACEHSWMYEVVSATNCMFSRRLLSTTQHIWFSAAPWLVACLVKGNQFWFQLSSLLHVASLQTYFKCCSYYCVDVTHILAVTIWISDWDTFMAFMTESTRKILKLDSKTSKRLGILINIRTFHTNHNGAEIMVCTAVI